MASADARMVPQRQMLPDIAWSDIGIGGRRYLREQRSGGHDLAGLAVAALYNLEIEPGLLGLLPGRVAPMASMVVMAWPTAAPTGITQARLGIPSTCTVQAPQSATRSRTSSRHAEQVAQHHSRGISGEASTVCDLPLIFSETMVCRHAIRVSPAKKTKTAALKGGSAWLG